ncbi:MAG: T9SS type A sorting domain-containing protein, partial [Candidatus Marinimicrobia bacterium]|nr:T9SS type A sorting domain-containing protein [Candidatus Neomarinimicrobiota bacterium]
HWAEQLTEQQRTELHELMSGLRDSGASREEIRAAVTELFTSWGIDLQEYRLGSGRHGPRPWAQQLTEEQRVELHELVSGLRDDGATREEIHAAVVTQLAEWGIDWSFDCSGEGRLGHRAARVRLIQGRNYPNPFNPSTQIAYTLTEPAMVEVAIYNLTGRLMRSYHQGSQPAGSYSVYWNGRTADGLPAPSGVYFYRIQAGNEVFTDRMLLMK